MTIKERNTQATKSFKQKKSSKGLTRLYIVEFPLLESLLKGTDQLQVLKEDLSALKDPSFSYKL